MTPTLEGTKLGGPYNAWTLKMSCNIEVHFALSYCTFQEVIAFSNRYISTSKTHN